MHGPDQARQSTDLDEVGDFGFWGFWDLGVYVGEGVRSILRAIAIPMSMLRGW